MKTEQDATGMFDVRQPSLAQHALDANTWAGGGSLGYFAHASTKFTEARLSQTSKSVAVSSPPPFFLCPLPPSSSQSGRSRSKRRTRRRHFYGKRLRRTMTNARILSESWTLAGSSVCSTLSPSAGARSPKLLVKINVGGATSSNLKGGECFGKIVDSCV